MIDAQVDFPEDWHCVCKSARNFDSKTYDGLLFRAIELSEQRSGVQVPSMEAHTRREDFPVRRKGRAHLNIEESSGVCKKPAQLATLRQITNIRKSENQSIGNLLDNC